MKQNTREFLWITTMAIGVAILAPTCVWLFPDRNTSGLRLAIFAIAAFLLLIFILQIVDILRRHDTVKKHLARLDASDDDFLQQSGIPDDAFQKRIALGVRRALAQVGGIRPAQILPEEPLIDRFWESIDWLDIAFHVERAEKVKIPKGAIEEALRRAGGRFADLRVKHLALAYAVMAQPGNWQANP